MIVSSTSSSGSSGRPGLGGDKGFVPERRPALLRQVRHHRVEQPHQDIGGLPHRPAIVGRWLSLELGERGLERIGELVDVGDADVEAQPLDVLRDLRERAVGGLAQRERRLAELRGAAVGGRPPRRPPRRTSRQSRCTKRPAPCTPSSVQITSRSGGESDSMNQRAVSAP